MKLVKTFLGSVITVILLFFTVSGVFAQEINYEEALRTINSERTKRRSLYRNNNILFYLDRGMVNHFLGNWVESSADLEEAERLIEEAFTRSLTQETATFILNDNLRDYPGEDYEDIYINIFNAFNYYNLGEIEKAHVEIRRVNEKLNFMADKYERAISKAGSADPRINTNDLEGINMEASKFSNSALARYLSLLFSRAEDNEDNMRIDWEELQRAFYLAPEIYGTMSLSLRASIEEDISIPYTDARLNVMAFTGLSPIKQEQRFIIPLLMFPFPNNTAPVSLPRMVRRPSNIEYVEVTAGERSFRLELLENIGSVAEETFKSRYALIVTKTLARTIIKTASTAAAGAAAERHGGRLAGIATRTAGRIAAGVSEQADLRISNYFPEKAYIGGINLEPGVYTVTINFYGSGSRLISSQQFDDVEITANNLNLIQANSSGVNSPERANVTRGRNRTR